jgi:hypothetical protein
VAGRALGLVRTRLELLLPVMAGGALGYGLAGFLLAVPGGRSWVGRSAIRRPRSRSPR